MSTENDWTWALQHCSRVRSCHHAVNKTIPYSFVFRQSEDDVLFLANTGEAALYSMSTSSESMGKCMGLVSPQPQTQALSQAAILLRERMRKVGAGITGYDYLEKRGELLVHLGSTSLLCGTSGNIKKELNFSGAVDIKACPRSCHLLACVLERDLWLMDTQSGTKTRLTHAHTPDTTLLSAGQPSFITQEEFDRFTGYWWQPSTPQHDGVYRILFEEVDETGVVELHTLNTSTQNLEHYRYPLVETKNATSTLKLLEFTVDSSNKVESKIKTLPQSFTDLWKDYEYMVRCDWLPDGQNVWVQLLDRSQQCLKLVLVPLGCFMEGGKEMASQCCVLLEESSPHWINVTDVVHFLPTASDAAHHYQFLWLSECSGYRHLELVTTAPPDPAVSTSDGLRVCTTHRKQLTAGPWVINGDQIWVDESRRLVYFMANVKSCVENHLHVVSWDGDGPNTSPTQLTGQGYNHEVTMDKACGKFISTYSSLQATPCSALFLINHLEDKSVTSKHCCNFSPKTSLPPNYVPPTIFSFQIESGETLYGHVMKPANCQPGVKYPTILYVYGGPHVQCVTNAFNSRLMKPHSWANAGYAVVTIDNRGSYNRGLAFEAHLQRTMGCVEVEDQVTGLQFAAELEQCIDLARVAVHGWSYGGYLSLMCLARRPEIFKIAIAGAPVTAWENYDTGYTERYLGLPTTNPTGYKESSVLTHVLEFPSEPNRLLMIHGLNDENVFFRHTSQLVDLLVATAKPYQLLVYSGERHGLRSFYSTKHYEATIMTFLKQHL